MTGVIRFRHVAAHPWIVAHEFGWRVLFRAARSAVSRRQVTFLELIRE